MAEEVQNIYSQKRALFATSALEVLRVSATLPKLNFAGVATRLVMSPLTAPQNYNRQIGVQDALKVHIGKIVAGLMNRKYVIVLKKPLFHTKI